MKAERKAPQFSAEQLEQEVHLAAATELCVRQDDLPWITQLIYKCRVDLQEKFHLSTEGGLFEYIAWLVRSAQEQYLCLQEDPEFVNFCAGRLIQGMPLNVLQTVVYLSAKELQDQFAMPGALKAYTDWFDKTFRQTGQGGITNIARMHMGVLPMPEAFREVQAKRSAGSKGNSALPFGVNIVGYVYGQLGIGEDARMTAKALEALGIPFCMVNFNPGPTIPNNDWTWQHKVVEEGPYSINLFCMTATETARHFGFMGRKQWEGRWNIGYWPWELDKWPSNWLPVNELIDEVWVSSQHIYKALQPVCSKPVTVVPLHVAVDAVSPLGRADFNLPETAKLFCFSFDLHSSVHRKNPQDCLRSFLESFPKGDRRYTRKKVGLVIKTHKPKRHSAEWLELKALAAADDRIHIIEDTLSRPDLLALYRCCDVFLSLHRAEGFGRGMAEAIKLGLHVVATNYSGNVDFCKAPECTLVDCELIPVEEGQYIEWRGMKWGGRLKLPNLSTV